jgi:hypothetical protein
MLSILHKPYCTLHNTAATASIAGFLWFEGIKLMMHLCCNIWGSGAVTVWLLCTFGSTNCQVHLQVVILMGCGCASSYCFVMLGYGGQFF